MSEPKKNNPAINAKSNRARRLSVFAHVLHSTFQTTGAMALLQSHTGVGFQTIGIRFQTIALSYAPRSYMPPSRPRPVRVGAWSSTPTPAKRSRTRHHPSCRSYSALFSAVDDSSGDDGNASNMPEGQNAPDDDDTPVDGTGDGGTVKPEPRADEQISVDEEGGATVAGEDQVDWDKAWASTRQRIEKERRAAPAFSGRKQIVATKNDEGGYDYEEISADGSRRMSGSKGSGAFGFADSSQVEEDGPGRIRRQEQEAVNLATTNQVG